MAARAPGKIPRLTPGTTDGTVFPVSAGVSGNDRGLFGTEYVRTVITAPNPGGCE